MSACSTDEYYTAPECYLKRAEALLATGRRQDLFYAAFELRCGVEQQYRYYVDHVESASEKARKAYQPDKLRDAYRLENPSVDLGIRMTLVNPKTLEIIEIFEHLPISPALHKIAERLGNYLHAPREFPDDVYFERLMSDITVGVKELSYTISSNTPKQPTIRREASHSTMSAIVTFDADLRDKMKLGDEFVAIVQHLYPKERGGWEVRD